VSVTVGSGQSIGTWTTTNPFTANVVVLGTQREGVALFLVQTGTSADQVSSVTLGGVAMTRVATNGFAQDTAGEAGAVYAYFLGSGVPVGNPVTLSVSQSATSGTKWIGFSALDAAADTEVVASGKLEGDRANPQIALDSGATEALRLCGVFSGLANVSDLTVVAGMTQFGNVDFGQQVGRVDHQTTASTGSFTIGYTSSSDDVAMGAVAVAEVAAAGKSPPFRRRTHPSRNVLLRR
jgi:hypothetical protein